MVFLDLRRDVHLFVEALGGFLDLEAGDFLGFFPFLPVDRQLLGGLRPLRQFAFELDDARLKLAARFAAMADFGFKLGNFGIGRVHIALRLMQGVASSKMRLAHGFGARLGFAQGGALCFEIGGGALDFERQALAFGLGLAFFQQPENLLTLHQLFVERVVTARHFGLSAEAFDLVAEFLADVLDAQQVFARVLETAVRFLAALLVARHAGGFFEEDAQVVRARLDDAGDHALADDGVGARPEAGTEEEIGNVLAADLLVVDEVVRLALAGQRALDRKLGILRPLAKGATEQVVKNQFDRSARHRLAVRRAVEDDVHHRLAAQLRRLGLAQHPAYGIHDVGFAAAIGADDADQLPGQGNRSRIDKGFETGEFEFGQSHEAVAEANAPAMTGAVS